MFVLIQSAVFGRDEKQEPDLELIDAYSVKMQEIWSVSNTPKDESIALVVNPFSVRKRGKYYGSVYEYHRNDNFDARNFFDPVGEPLPEFKRNQFGLSFGALVTKRLKVFGSYDGLRIIKGSTMLSMVPTPEMKRGDFSAIPAVRLVDPFTHAPFSGNRIPQERISPVAAKLLSLYPDPTRDDPMRNYVNNQPFGNNNNSIGTRIDYEFNPQTKIYGNYSINDGSQSLVSTLPSFGTSVNQRTQSVSADLTHSFSSNKVLNLHLSFDRNTSTQISKQAFHEGLLASIGINGVRALDGMDEGYPQMDIMGYASLGFGFGFSFPGNEFASGSPETFCQNTFGFKSDYTYVHGNHTIAVSGTLNSIQLNSMRTWGSRRGQFGFSGLFTGDAFADFLMGIPYTAQRGVGSNRSDLRRRSWQLAVKDDWKINRNFTLNLSLAYGYTPFFRSINNRVSLFYPLLFDPSPDGDIVVAGSSAARELGLNLNPGESAYADRNDWEPSFGIAYSPFGNNSLVIRASYKITHGFMSPIQALFYVGRNYPFFYIEKAESPTTPDLNLTNPFASSTAAALTIKAADPHLRNPYIQQWNGTLQYEFMPSWSLELAYDGQKTTHLFRTIPANVPLPAAAGTPIQQRRPNPKYGEFDIMTSGASYTSYAINAQLQRRLTGSFSLQTGFTWNRALSDCWGWAFVNPNNPRNMAAERSTYAFAAPMQFNVNYIFDLPLGRGKLISTSWAGKLAPLFEGWRISGITTLASGWPYNPEIFGDPNNDGVWGDRPNRVGSGILPASNRSVDKWFETSDFVMPDYSGSNPQWFGDSGRNILLSPAERKWDVSILKRTKVSGDGNLLEFRVQLFNAFNNVNFQQPGNIVGTPTFGVISNAENAREIEVALKYTF